MLDPALLRESPREVAQQLQKRGVDFDWQHYQQLEQQRKLLQQQTENLQAQRNRQAKAVGELKRKGEDVSEVIRNMADLGQQLDDDKRQLTQIQQTMLAIQHSLPNLADERVPVGTDEQQNQLVSHWGQPREFDFECLDHVDFAEQRGWLDVHAASQMAASRFTVLRGELATLHRALAQFMLNYHIHEGGYEEVNVPLIVNDQALMGTGQLPKFKEDLFAVQNGDEAVQDSRQFYLIPTAEVPLTNLVAQTMVSLADLPKRWVAHTPCFRSEAGNSGRDTRGLIRQHQFEKVELVNVCRADQSWDCLEQMTKQAEHILQQLELPYRKVALCTGDLGFASAFTYDLEVWLPSQNTYREISSLSNCMDFQARRLQARYKDSDGQRQWVHTLNGSGVAVGRALVALLENHQQQDGRLAIPNALRAYLQNADCL